MFRSSKSKLWSMFCGGLLAGWLVSCLLPPYPTSAEPTTNGLPFEQFETRLKALEAKSSLISVNDGMLALKGQVDFVNGENKVTASINGVDPTKGIIAILDCPSELDRQSLTVNGPVLFKSENGSSVQINNCHDQDAPAVKINVAGGGEQAPADKTALLVTGPASTKPLVEFATSEPLFVVESAAAVQVINPWEIPTLPMIVPRPAALRVFSREGETTVSADGIETENHLLATHACLNSIELLVRCGNEDVSPAGLRMNPETGRTRF